MQLQGSKRACLWSRTWFYCTMSADIWGSLMPLSMVLTISCNITLALGSTYHDPSLSWHCRQHTHALVHDVDLTSDLQQYGKVWENEETIIDISREWEKHSRIEIWTMRNQNRFGQIKGWKENYLYEDFNCFSMFSIFWIIPIILLIKDSDTAMILLKR